MPGRAHDQTFRTLFEPHRRAITLHCYRLLGSLQDAEEITQEVLLRAWHKKAEVSAPETRRGWLYAIATNACLDQLVKARRRRALPHLLGPAARTVSLSSVSPAERFWVEPAPDALLEAEDEPHQRPDARISQRESIGLAFITALQRLSPKQRAALILVDVLGWSPTDTAELIETSVFSVSSLLQRARKNLRAHQEPAAELADTDPDLLRRFITTWESGDLDAFTALLATDAILSMPPQPEWFEGRSAIGAFFAAVWSSQPGQRRLVPLAANGQPAFAVYRQPTADASFEPSGLVVLTVRRHRVAQMTRFAFPRLFSLFGLPLNPRFEAVKRFSG